MFKKTARVLFSVVAVLLLLLVLFPLVFRKQISNEVRNLLNENYNAKIDYADLSFSLLQHFPNPTVSLEQFVAVGKDEFEGDTLASFQKLEVSFGWLSLFKGGNYNIQSISVIEPVVKLRVNKSGKANWDITKNDLPASENLKLISYQKNNSFGVSFNRYKIEHGIFSLLNDSARSLFMLKDVDFSGQAGGMDADGSSRLGLDFNVKELSYAKDNFAYVKNISVEAESSLLFDSSGITWFNRDLWLNSFLVRGGGTIKKNMNGLEFRISWATDHGKFSDLLPLIPLVRDLDTANFQAQGNSRLMINVEGLYNGLTYPEFGVHVYIDNCRFHKKGNQEQFENVLLDARLTKSQGPLDSAVIEVSKFHIESGNDSINASIKIVTPVSDANVSFHINGNADLHNLAAFIPGQDSSVLSGKAAVNATLKFRQSDINNKAYKNIMAEGNLDLQNLTYSGYGFSAPINIKEARFSFHPEFVSLERVDLSIAKSKVSGNGKIGNAIPYLMHAGNLNVALNLQSEELNLHDLIVKAPEPKVVKNVSPVKPLAVDRKGEKHDVLLTINAAIKKLYYDKLLLQNLKGQLTLNADTIRIKDLHAELLGGNAVLNSEYINAGDGKPDFNFHSNASDINLKQLYAVMDNAEKVAPSLKYISGNFSGEVKGKGKLKADKSVNYSALNADGNLQIATLKIDELPTLTRIGKLAKAKSLDHLEAKNVQSIFHFKNGQTEFEPTDIKFTNGYRLAFHGTHYPNQTVDADVGLNVPVKEFGSIANMAQNLLSGFINMPENVHFDFKLTGNNQHPDIKLAGVNTAGN